MARRGAYGRPSRVARRAGKGGHARASLACRYVDAAHRARHDGIGDDRDLCARNGGPRRLAPCADFASPHARRARLSSVDAACARHETGLRGECFGARRTHGSRCAARAGGVAPAPIVRRPAASRAHARVRARGVEGAPQVTAKADIDWFKRGREHQWGGRPIDAMLCFRRAIAAAPNDGDARFHLGEVQWSLGLLDGAKAAWTEASRIAPRHVASRLALAEACLNTGDAPGAKAAAEHALALSPNDGRARAFLLIAKAALGEPDVDWGGIAAAVQGKPNMLGAPARARLIGAALDRTDGAAGRDALVDVLVAMLDHVPLDLLGPLADALIARGGEDSAIARIFAHARGLEVAPRSAEAWRRLALAADRTGDAEAKREFASRYA